MTSDELDRVAKHYGVIRLESEVDTNLTRRTVSSMALYPGLIAGSLYGIHAMSIKKCTVCKQGIADPSTRRTWNNDDSGIGLAKPPPILSGSIICQDCYNSTNGPIMADLIQKNQPEIVGTVFPPVPRIKMPDGSDGLNCLKCGEYYPWVEPNHSSGYVCKKHRV